MNDLRFALRQLLKSPGFTTVAVLTLAIGIGSATAMFSSLRALVIEPFSYPNANALVHVWSNDGQPLSQPDYFDFVDRAKCFAEFGTYSPRAVNLGGENPQSVRNVSLTPGVLRAFGVQPQLGRLLDDNDELAGAAPVALISHQLWHRSFGGDPALIGRQIRVNGGLASVVGIMPPDFEFAAPWMRSDSCDMWTPLQLKRGEGDRGSHWMCAVGRLKPGVTVAEADAEIKAIGAQLKAEYPNTNAQKPFLVRSLHEEMTRGVGSRVWMLFGAVALVLLVACANVASMLLARSAKRQAEFGIRLALGANRRQLIRLALSESVLLAIAGAVVGLVLAVFGIKLLTTITPTTDARRAAMVLDGSVLAFSVGITFLTALIAGVPPALAALRVSVSDLLRTDSRGAAGSRARHRLLRGLIIGQVTLAFVLANGAALFSASYVKLLSANSTLATEYVLTAELHLRGDRYAKTEARTQFWETLAQRAGSVPGVTAAGLTTRLPLEGGSNMWILVNDEVFDPTAKRTLAEVRSVSPGFFAAAGIPLLRGRTLEPGDAGKDEIGVVVNRALAEKCWPGKDPIGQIIRPSNVNAYYHARVVGLVDNVRQWGPETEARPEMSWTADRAWGNSLFLVVRSAQPAAQLTAALREVVRGIDADLPFARVRTFQTVVDEAMRGQRAVVQTINFFMAVALALLAVGIYGTLSYHVLQRTREIGVRMAMGASQGEVIKLVFRQGSTWVAIGVGLGIGGAIGLTFAIRSLVYGLESVDPWALVWAMLAIGGATLIACWLPARRASRVDPILALRTD